ACGASSTSVEQANGLQNDVAGDLYALGAQFVDGVVRSVMVCVAVSVIEVNDIRHGDAEPGKRIMIVGDLVFRFKKIRLVSQPGWGREHYIPKPLRRLFVAQDVEVFIADHVGQQESFDLLVSSVLFPLLGEVAAAVEAVSIAPSHIPRFGRWDGLLAV